MATSSSTSGRVIRLPGFRIDKHGRIVRDERRLDASTRLLRRTSKRVCVANSGPTASRSRRRTSAHAGQLYAVHYFGELLLERRAPVLAARRPLLARGITGRLEVWRRSRQHADMQVDILRGAGWAITEDDRGLRLQRWTRYPRIDCQIAFAAACPSRRPRNPTGRLFFGRIQHSAAKKHIKTCRAALDFAAQPIVFNVVLPTLSLALA